MAGATNPLRYSRYKWARSRILQNIYQSIILRFIFLKVDKVVAINNDCYRLCLKVNRKRCIKIPLGVDTSLFKKMEKTKMRKKFDLPKNSKIIIYVGRLSKVKGLDLLLKAFSIYIEKVPNSKLILVGDGEERTNLESNCKILGICDNVIFKGEIKHQNLPEILNCADIFVMTSYAEGLPNSLLEAMSCELPVISTNVGGVKELIQSNKNGIVLKNRDPNVLFRF